MEDNLKDIKNSIEDVEGRVGIQSLIISGQKRIDLQDAFVLVEQGNITERLNRIDRKLVNIEEDNREFRENWQKNWALGRTAFISVMVTCVILISLAAYAVRTYGSENTGRIITGIDGALEEVR